MEKNVRERCKEEKCKEAKKRQKYECRPFQRIEWIIAKREIKQNRECKKSDSYQYLYPFLNLYFFQ